MQPIGSTNQERLSLALTSFLKQILQEIHSTHSEEDAFEDEEARELWANLLASSISTLLLLKRAAECHELTLALVQVNWLRDLMITKYAD